MNSERHMWEVAAGLGARRVDAAETVRSASFRPMYAAMRAISAALTLTGEWRQQFAQVVHSMCRCTCVAIF